MCLECRAGQTHVMYFDQSQAVDAWNKRVPTAFEKEYTAWMQYHDTGQGDFQGFIAQYHNMK
ncbi:hypothetical protein CEK28_10625 [Xenophilus sp. AP218F]|nr:hypothetical protein CEK28_10625 [Xenophilus sp. AP218F]